MNNRKFRIIVLFLTLFLFFIIPFPSITAHADMGPKPSIRISFENAGDTPCYGTLLSKSPSTGPHSVWDGNEEHIYTDVDKELFLAFVNYQDIDGYYFLQTVWDVGQDKEIAWTYYPPKNFKILLYYPVEARFVVSDVYERYAFDSYFNVKIEEDALVANRSYDYTSEILGLLARILLTIALEAGIAFLFGFRGKKEFFLLVGANTFTQILLNVWVNVRSYKSGGLAALVSFLNLEFLVFAIEAIFYCLILKKVAEKPHKIWFYVLYALIANLISFLFGLFLAGFIPFLF